VILSVEPEIRHRVSERSKTVRIIVRGEYVEVVRSPHISLRFAESFAESKRDWIIQAVNRQAAIVTRLPADTVERYRVEKPAALELAYEKVEQWNQFYQFDVSTIVIRRMSSRWGSCSSKGRLCFSYRLLHLPEPLQDYLVVHELCHLRHMHHGPSFWAEVGRAVPDYKQRRQELRRFV